MISNACLIVNRGAEINVKIFLVASFLSPVIAWKLNRNMVTIDVIEFDQFVKSNQPSVRVYQINNM